MPLFFGRNGHPGRSSEPNFETWVPGNATFFSVLASFLGSKKHESLKIQKSFETPNESTKKACVFRNVFRTEGKLHTANPCHILVAYVCDLAAIYVLKFLLVGFFGVGSALRFSSLGLFVRLGHLACIAAHPVTLRSGWGMRCLMAHDGHNIHFH